jgi:hypothetical protein
MADRSYASMELFQRTDERVDLFQMSTQSSTMRSERRDIVGLIEGVPFEL